MDFSVDNIKKNVRWLAYFAVSLFHLIFMAMPFLGVDEDSASGYQFLDASEWVGGFEEFEFFKIFAFFMTIANIIAILLILATIYILVVKFFGEAISVDLPLEFGPVKLTSVVKITFLVYAIIETVIFAFISFISLIFNSAQDVTSMGPGIGLWFMFLFSLGSVITLRILSKKMPELFEETAGAARFVCEQCGTPAKAGAPFCQTCGGKVVELPPPPTIVYVCEQCGTKGKAGVAFCSKCGGRVMAKEQYPVVHLCTQCGAKSKAGVAFCPACGGKVEAKELRPENQGQPTFQAQPNFQQAQPNFQQAQAQPSYVCSQCGTPAAPGTKFCQKCGGQIVQR